MAIKVLITGFENTGKSTLASKVKDALIINCDRKDYPFSVPHSTYPEWKGFQSFTDFVNSKIKAYKEKFKKYPKYVVFDTITQLYVKMTAYNKACYQGFNIHSQNDADTLAINEYIENVLLKNDINVIIMAHTKVDSKTDRFEIPAQGAFKSTGSWVGIVTEAIYINRVDDEHSIILKNNAISVVRTNLQFDDDIVSIPFNEFDINKHLDEISKLTTNAKKEEL